ncbi:FtsK/SpoIIIE domain-containing protein [Sporolactobacillus sp. STSJ-5]|uniref:FtsK/SpoIIIE domain-containing protein n=1 Tax=Sporolactobacillus sp. STSJ-5 TaxID=2965076 RepID=UPI00210858BB|nr:FtsK/SpoIIIE domain-containing protein [Sporolactobacillus sp. STSJ-5]MCQ2009278.1 FtsK/SpoIIIE domain-containing protein [Sporolactobacillus sp. STSJ-5]
MSFFIRFDPYYRKLQQCFRVAGLCRKNTIGGTVYEVQPFIHSVQHKLSEVILTFTLPNGMDPKSVKKVDYAFKQMFGSNTAVDGELKKFTVHVYKKQMPKTLKYSRSLVDPAIEGMSLPIVTGVDATGTFQAFDLRNHPHVLVAGATGYGKSSALRAILTTLMLYKSPEELRFVLGDLKYSEMTLFRGYSHVESVSTSAATLALELAKVRHELERRGKMLEKARALSTVEIGGIADIVVCIDEVALLKKEKEVMALIEDISAIGRALGVYLILSMQRPDADVLDGKLKNNLNVRISFKQADKINSKIILDQAGAEKLPCPGRAIVKTIDTQVVQAPFITAAQVEKLLEPFFTQVPSILQKDLIEQEQGQQFGLLEDDDDD